MIGYRTTENHQRSRQDQPYSCYYVVSDLIVTLMSNFRKIFFSIFYLSCNILVFIHPRSPRIDRVSLPGSCIASPRSINGVIRASASAVRVHQDGIRWNPDPRLRENKALPGFPINVCGLMVRQNRVVRLSVLVYRSIGILPKKYCIC